MLREMAVVLTCTRAGAAGLSAHGIGAVLLALVVGCAAPDAPTASPSDPAAPMVIGGCELL